MFWPLLLKPIPDHPKYYACPAGHIWSKWYARVRRLRPSLSNMGYPQLSVYVDGRQLSRRVHRLVHLAFHGPIDDGLECCHLDGNPKNSRPDNLTALTHIENERQKLMHGVAKERKLTEADARAIKYAENGTQGAIARKYGINYRTVGDIRKGRTWKHI